MPAWDLPWDLRDRSWTLPDIGPPPWWLLAALAAVALVVLAAYARGLMRALGKRRGFLVVATPRTGAMPAEELMLYGRMLSAVRLRRRNGLMKPAGAVRLTMELALLKPTIVQTVQGPAWMAGALDSNHHPGIMVAALDLVDLRQIGFTSILAPEAPAVEAPTVDGDGGAGGRDAHG